MTTQQRSSSQERLSTSAAPWSQLLREETLRIEETGVGAAIASIRLSNADERTHRQVVGLLGRLLGPTDTFNVADTGLITVLIAPSPGIVELSARMTSLESRLVELGCAPLLGYAIRRRDESLLDTLARSDASVDRARARQAGSASVIVLPQDD